MTFPLRVNNIGEWSEFISHPSSTRKKLADIFLIMKKSIESGVLFGSVGQ
jgi:hypothetical protein